MKNVVSYGTESDFIKAFIEEFTNASDHIKYLKSGNLANAVSTIVNDDDIGAISTPSSSQESILCSFLIDDTFVIQICSNPSHVVGYVIRVYNKTNLNLDLANNASHIHFASMESSILTWEDLGYRILNFGIIQNDNNFILYNPEATENEYKWGLWFFSTVENNNIYHYFSQKSYDADYSSEYYEQSVYQYFINAENRPQVKAINRVSYTYDASNSNNLEFIRNKTFIVKNIEPVQKAFSIDSVWDCSKIPEYLFISIPMNNVIMHFFSVDEHTLILLGTTTNGSNEEE